MNEANRSQGRKLLGLVLIWASLIVALILISTGTHELRISKSWNVEDNRYVQTSDDGIQSIPVWLLCASCIGIGMILWFAPSKSPATLSPRRKRHRARRR